MRSLSLTTLALSTSTASAAVSARNSSNPCVALSSSYLAQSNLSSPLLQPSLLGACIQEVPIDESAAVAQIKWLKSYIELQSTLAYLKNPPSDYPFPPVDILGGLDDISSKASNRQYSTEYEFERDIYNLIVRANDGHLAYGAALISSFSFTPNIPLVSVSLDGVQLPKVYFLSDIQAKYSGASNASISALSLIDGIDASQYLEQVGAQIGGFQDQDAQWNGLFYSVVPVPGSSSPNNGGWSVQNFFFQNDTTQYDFENGTSTTGFNNVTSQIPINYSSGEEVLQFLLHPPPPPPTSNASSPSGGTPSTNSSGPLLPISSGWPVPLVEQPSALLTGYFLEEPGLTDVAVLSIPTFDPGDDDAGFVQTAQSFFDKAHEQQKSRLIIDVRGNGGGTAPLAYDIFQRLFPSIAPYSGVRLRNSPQASAIGDQTSKNPNAFNSSSVVSSALQLLKGSAFDPNLYLYESNGQPYTTWEEYSKPIYRHGDNYTQIAALNLPAFGDTAPGKGQQPFAGENIILLTDAACSSTCTVFSNLLINQGNVTSVVGGGRPSLDPMVVIGGVQGSNELPFSIIKKFARDSLEIVAYSTGSNSSDTQNALEVLGTLDSEPPIQLATSGASLNVRDNIADGDTTETPLQFTRLYSDCRFFYTPGDIFNVTYTWSRIANGIAAGGRGLCINGTIGHFADASGNATAFGFGSTAAGSNSTASGSGSAAPGGSSASPNGTSSGSSPSGTFSGAPTALPSSTNRPISANPNAAPAGFLQNGGILLVAVQCISVIYYVLAF